MVGLFIFERDSLGLFNRWDKNQLKVVEKANLGIIKVFDVSSNSAESIRMPNQNNSQSQTHARM